MANNEIYLGTKDGFKKYFGPYLRNLVKSFTKSSKNCFGNVCEHCHRETTLEAAHVRGRERPQIIDEVLDENFKNKDNDYYTVNLLEFEKIFTEKHLPIRKHFYFLCRDCHRAYDQFAIDLPEFAADDIKQPVYEKSKQQTQSVKQTLPIFPQQLPQELERGGDETVQDYVKRILFQLQKMDLLTETVLQQLQDANYSKIMFALDFPMLAESTQRIIYAGHKRYWTRYRFGKYYVCSQWWLEKTYDYTRKIYAWLEKLFANREN